VTVRGVYGPGEPLDILVPADVSGCATITGSEW
jgi:hypothetical protein